MDADEFDSELINHGEGTAQVHIGERRSGLGREAAKARGAKAAASRKVNRQAREASASG